MVSDFEVIPSELKVDYILHFSNVLIKIMITNVILVITIVIIIRNISTSTSN